VEESIKFQISKVDFELWKGKPERLQAENVPVTFLPSDTAQFEHGQVPSNWFLRPFLHLFLVQCEVRHCRSYKLTFVGFRSL
jgi:hypothetical protein